MLRYKETHWKYKTGIRVRSFHLTIDTISPSKTREEQHTRKEKISLVAFLCKDQKKSLFRVGRRIKRNNANFYQNSNLHVTLFGFGPLEKEQYEVIQGKIREFSRREQGKEIAICFNAIRPGALYSGKKDFGPVNGLSNGTVIAIGNVSENSDFCSYSNQLGSFLLQDKHVSSFLGTRFRRKFPTVWCTLGYYNSIHKFKIRDNLSRLFKQYNTLSGNAFNFHISEISLVKSNYKNLRHHTVIEEFKV